MSRFTPRSEFTIRPPCFTPYLFLSIHVSSGRSVSDNIVESNFGT